MAILTQLLVFWKILIPALISLVALISWLIWRRSGNRAKQSFLGTLSAGQCRRLQNAKVPYYPGIVAGQCGILVKRKNCQKALNALQATVRESVPGTEKEANIERLLLNFALEEDRQELPSIRFLGRFPLPETDIAEVVAVALMPLVARDIVVYGEDSPPPPDGDDGKFHLLVSPNLKPRQPDRRHLNHHSDGGPFSSLYYPYVAPHNIWGLTNRSELQAREPSPLAVPYIDWDTNFYPLELQDNKLYFLFDVLAGQKEDLSWLERLMPKLASSTREPLLNQFKNCLVHFGEAIEEERDLQKFLAAQGIDEPAPRLIPGNKSETIAAPAVDTTVLQFIEKSSQLRRPWLIGELATQILGPIYGQSLTIINLRGNIRPPDNGHNSPTALNIFYHGAPSQTRTTDSPRQYWQYRAMVSEKLYGPSPQGIPMYTPDGDAVAELIGNNLYVFPNLMPNGTILEAKLWAAFLLEARKLILEVQQCADPELLMAEAFGKECLRQVERLASGSSQGELKPLAAKHGNALRATIEKMRTLYQTEKMPFDDLGDEFDSLLAIPKVTKVEVNDRAILVRTKTLYCTDPRTNIRHEIGPFEISIHPESADGLRWFNKNGLDRPNNHNAPHVNSEGKACLGNMAEVFKQLISTRQYAAAIEAAIAFVEAVNVDDVWGKRISEWPVASSRAEE